MQCKQFQIPHMLFGLRTLLTVLFFVMAGSLFTHSANCAEQVLVKVGFYENSPKIFSDDNGTITGFWPELLQYIAQKEHWKIEYIRGTWDEGLTRLKASKIDIMVDVAFTEKRNKLYVFSEKPVLMSWSRLYVNKDDTTIQSIQNLHNTKIAALQNSVNLEGAGGLREILSNFHIPCTFIELNNYKEVFQAIADKKVDAGITNRNFGNKNAKDYAVKKTPIIFQPINMKFAFPKGSATTPHLAQKINYHMARMIADEDSLYYQLLKKYFEAGITEKQVAVVPGWLKTFLSMLTFLFVVLIFTIFFIRYQVQKKTRQIQELNTSLQRSEEKYRTIADESPDLRYRVDNKGKITYLSKAVEKLYGYTKEEGISQYTFDIYHNPNDRKQFLTTLQKNGFINNFIFKAKRKDGSIWWASSNAHLLKDDDGNIMGIDGITRDITIQKEAEIALWKSNQEWYKTFDAFPDIVTLQNTDLRIIKANQAASSTLGLQYNELIGTTCHELFEGSSIPCEGCPLLKTKEHFQSYTREIYHQKLDKTFLVSASPVLDENKNIEYIVHVARDISKLKEAEQERARLATAIKQAAEAICITNANGDLQYVNPAFEKLTGYSRGEVLKQNPRILQSGKHDQRFYENMWATLLRGSTWHGRLINRKKDGSFFEEEATISPVKNSSGKITNFVAVKRDVSKEIALEHQLRQAIKMEAIGTLAGGIAHDFNNILSVIIGCTEIIQEEANKGSQIEQNSETILSAGKRAADLVRQILTFSRHDVSNKAVFSPYPVACEALKMLRSTLPVTVTIKEDIDADCGMILADETIVHQIFINLCTNSLQALPQQKGILHVQLQGCKTSKDKGSTPEDFIVISVRDNGCGMDQNTIDRIFDPYFTTKEIGKGTGLGLAIIHGAVEEYEGFIEVESTPGKGSVFSVFLPRIKQESIQKITQKKKPIKDITPGSSKILVVDDELLLVRINSRRLENQGYQVTAFTDPREALNAFQKQPEEFDLLITDQTMPNITGKELAEAVLKIKPSLPIIMCTGHSDTVSKEDSIALGIKKYVYKPLLGDELLEAVHEVLNEE